MFDHPAESPPADESSATALRFRAGACRALAELSDTAERKAVWIERAEYWEELAAKADAAA